MKIRDVGEWKLIETIFEEIRRYEFMPLPYGDDASALHVREQKIVVINSDMLVASTDVPPGMTFRQVGRKATVMCISDLAAKGAKPLALLFALGLKAEMKLDDFKELIRGLDEGAKEYGAYIIGGDVNEACDLIISGTAIGVADHVISRGGAKEGDIVAVTGKFGNTAAGLKILLEGIDAPSPLKEKILKAVYTPKAQVKEGIALAQSTAVTASIDSSDGLAISLHEIASRSKVGFEIKTLPISEEAAEFARIHNIDPFELVFYGGEEYHLVVTIKKELFSRARKVVESVGGQLIPIGEVVKGDKVIFKKDDIERVIEKRGWEHFARK
ncbi:MAG: thiamine-phosphate kinase [Candidatus Methanomethylicota archaeon]|uniref:Thiamine-monophosphate kinase n=1 Tax=Thermoproteota archaeon TaxID=2056631 RepID=A0A497EX24_9CREN|nr:MAG: thiamine-phosphate kinase [Candidatus Verstraetearchaeota archaeon]RLE55921.1 MAG: thiamine-phosphate kinase [Candidatus Verstraetearchaeota archaeon]